MSEISKTHIQSKWQELGECFTGMKENIEKAGKLVCWLLDNDSDARDKFRKAGITPSFYNRLEKVGRGTLLPELAEYTRFQKLPLDQQRQVLAGQVTALIEKEDGTFDTIKVDVLRAPTDIAKRVIAYDHIRTPEEQRRIIERTRVPKFSADEACKMPWRVVGNKVEFVKPCILTRADLISVMKAMEG